LAHFLTSSVKIVDCIIKSFKSKMPLTLPFNRLCDGAFICLDFFHGERLWAV
jgi:hypothetical protein